MLIRKSKMKKRKFKLNKYRAVAAVVIPVLLISALATKGFGAFAADCASVADCQQQINSLSDQNAQDRANLNTLEAQAGSYQAAIAAINAQITGLQQQIVANEAQQVQAQAELDKEKQVLGENIKTMYLEGDISTLEVLASSNDLSSFVNKETYRTSVQNNIKSTLDKVTALKEQLIQLHNTLTSQQAQLAAAQAEQSRLLALNEDQQNQFDAQIASNQSAITQLRAKIVALNTPVGSNFTFTGSCGGGYPADATGPYGHWGCNYPKDNTADVWGMYNRECVSYTAFMVHQEYIDGQIAHDMPNWGGVGNAYQWIDDARNAGIPVDQNPQPGDIAIRPASGISGDVGHAMYVGSVGSGQIYVQQYNADLQGNYSYGWRSSAGLYFLHFSQWR